MTQEKTPIEEEKIWDEQIEQNEYLKYRKDILKETKKQDESHIWIYVLLFILILVISFVVSKFL